MQVVGIDPAPKKGLFIFDGKDKHVSLSDARAYLDELSVQSDILVCWDAPLTGPPATVLDGAIASGSAFTKRPIEQFFSRKDTGFKTPKGVSVLGYAGCPHWTLSRSLVGLPRTGPYDAPLDALPFELAMDDNPPTNGKWIAEVHPALALWLWLRELVAKSQDWQYKKSQTLQTQFWNLLLEEVFSSISDLRGLVPPRDDDEFDARISFALGTLWIRHKSECPKLLGDLTNGTFLIPVTDRLEQRFSEFINRAGC
jgi:hypothetical protein